MKKLTILLPLFLTACGTTSLTVTNPVIDADAPDPTVIRVGDTYYAAATSGNSRQAYARYKADGPEGTFVDHGPFIRTTNEAIDAFVYNDDGQLYVTWKAYGLDPSKRPIEILAQRLSADGMRLEGEPFMLLRDDERQGMEGQCIFREGKYYYMLYSIRDCCTPQSDYAVSVARSESFSGPWEKFSGNPILTGNSRDIQSCGHGTLVTTPFGKRYYLCHAYYLNRYKEGRKAILQQISIGKDLWPTFGPAKTVKAQSKIKVKL